MQHARALLWHLLLRLATLTGMPAWMWQQHYGIPTRRYTRVTDGGTTIEMVPALYDVERAAWRGAEALERLHDAWRGRDGGELA